MKLKGQIQIRRYIRQQLDDYPTCFVERETGEVLTTKLAEDVANNFELDTDDEETFNDLMDLIEPIAAGVERANGARPLFPSSLGGIINSKGSDWF